MTFPTPLLPGRRQHRILEALSEGDLTMEQVCAVAARDGYSRATNRKRTEYAIRCLKHRQEIVWPFGEPMEITRLGLRALGRIGRRAA